VLQHLLGVEIRNQERNIIALSQSASTPTLHRLTYLNRLPPQDKKGLCALRQESRELVHKDMLNLIRLLDLDADSNAIDAGLDQDALVLISGDGERVQQHFW
jgi:hypothetical protein